MPPASLRDGWARQVCSDQCRQYIATPYCVLPADHWVNLLGKSSAWPRFRDQVERIERSRSPLTIAVRDGDHAAVIKLIKRDCKVTANGCWEWQRGIRDGYPYVRLNLNGKKGDALVHRLSLEAKHGKPLGKQPAHHMCANTACTNPDHLQPVTHRENVAEMMQRNYFIARIQELEAALMETAPDHDLLTHIGTPMAA
jgi:hypothetical protein